LESTGKEYLYDPKKAAGVAIDAHGQTQRRITESSRLTEEWKRRVLGASRTQERRLRARKGYTIFKITANDIADEPARDDMHTAEEIRKRMRNSSRSIIVSEGFSAEQLKGIIGCCDVVVAARYHSIVACLSQGIPVLAIGWHAKYAAVLALFGQEQHLASVETLELDVLKAQFDELWQSREHISQKILATLPKVTKSIYACGRKVHQEVWRRECPRSEVQCNGEGSAL